jgi:hypothetical protein
MAVSIWRLFQSWRTWSRIWAYGIISGSATPFTRTKWTPRIDVMGPTHAPGAAFQFLSGRGTNPRSWMMWARVKGETEEDLKALGLARLNCFRPAYIHPVEPRTGQSLGYRLMRHAYQPLRALSKSGATTNVELARSMLQATIEELDGHTFENPDVNALAARYAAR